jgi:hypothetical protein
LNCSSPHETWFGIPPGAGTNGCNSSWIVHSYSGTITVTGGTNVSLDVSYSAEPGGSTYNCPGTLRGCTIYSIHCYGTATAM